MICEGPTEQAFANTNLQQPFINRGISLQTPTIKKSRGGVIKWVKLKQQIENHFKSEPGVYVTTLIDYYGVSNKHEFPGWEEAHRIVDKNSRMDSLENSMLQDIDPIFQNRFIPYLQLHEFEGLLFNDIDIIKSQIPPEDLVGLNELSQTIRDYPNPEMINDNKYTSPSHRLERIISGYNKVVYGDIIAEAIGLVRIREKSPRFNNWITRLENI